MADELPPELSAILIASDAETREQAWEQFVATHGRLLLHGARSLGRDYDGVMDRYAFVLERLRENDFHRLRAYTTDRHAKFTTWLLVVTRRLCLDHYRQRYGRGYTRHNPDDPASRARAARRRLADSMGELVDVALLDDAGHVDPAHELEGSQRQAHLDNALGSLSPPDRLLLKLRFEEDLPAREIAAVVGLPTPFHVYRRLNALLSGLRATLHQSGFDREDL
jgi:RNA polymerase sigma factor (sigma-70 family)